MTEPSYDKKTIISLLNSFSEHRDKISWRIRCTFCDGMGTTYNEIRIIDSIRKRCVGSFLYHVETGIVIYCRYKHLKKQDSENIIDMILDMMNYER